MLEEETFDMQRKRELWSDDAPDPAGPTVMHRAVFSDVPRDDANAPMRTANRHGEPVSFGTFGGFLHPGDGSLGVLMLSAIGFEEMCVRSTWRTLATRISEAGMPCLRFDYPGVGDALDPERAPDGIEDWKEAVRTAARQLREMTGVEEIALVGQGLGGALAMAIDPSCPSR